MTPFPQIASSKTAYGDFKVVISKVMLGHFNFSFIDLA